MTTSQNSHVSVPFDRENREFLVNPAPAEPTTRETGAVGASYTHHVVVSDESSAESFCSIFFCSSIFRGRATHPPALPYCALASSSGSSPGPKFRIESRWESIPEPSRPGSNAQCRWYTWLCPENAAVTSCLTKRGHTCAWNSSATPTSLASRTSSPSFPSSDLTFFGPHVHDRSSPAGSTPKHDLPQSESTRPGLCPANKTHGVSVLFIPPSALFNHRHWMDPLRKSTSVFIDTNAIGPIDVIHVPGGDTVRPCVSEMPIGSRRFVGTPHSPPESAPPYTSAMYLGLASPPSREEGQSSRV